MTATDADPGLKIALEKVLDRHGYGFQYAIIRRVYEVLRLGASPWSFEVSEFPAAVQGADTRLDFILRNRSGSWYLLAECKRANPALSNWCFVRAPFVAHGRSGTYITCERVSADDFAKVSGTAARISSHPDVYHIAIEVRSADAGDAQGSGRGAVEEAAGQVSRGLNGVVEWLRSNPSMLRNASGSGFSSMSLTPVIFTTASLWASAADLKEADILTGKLPIRDLRLEQRPWLWLQYHTSPGIKHTVPSPTPANSFADALEQQFSRSIAIVSAAGISDFLAWEP